MTRLLQGDFSNIEGRVTAWLADEAWKLQAFKDYDAGTGPDLYNVAYAESFGVPVETVTKDNRQIGKVEELALGFGGGPIAFASMGANYRVDMGEQFDHIVAAAAQWAVDEAFEAWDAYGSRMGMGERAWKASDIVKRLWRKRHPKTERFWKAIEGAAHAAVTDEFPTIWNGDEMVPDPDVVMKIGKDGSRAFSVAGGRIVFKRRGSFLFCRLPSGRALCYCYPKIRSKKTPWGKDKQTLFYSGVDTSKGAGGKWCDIATYGGKLTENCVQASARDLLRDAMIRVEAAGYPIVMHVHDEIVSEVPNGFGSHEEFLQLMSICPSWAAGLPVAAGGWEGVRYRKD